MNDVSERAAAIAAYRAAVVRHLDDLPETIRRDLVADLEIHLAEVHAVLRPDESLDDRLGDPESYARELRETVEPEHAVAKLRKGLGHAADRYTGSAGVGGAADFGKAAVPGWWVVRGFLTAGLIFTAVWKTLQRTPYAIVDWLTTLWPVTALLFAALALACVWLSLRLGAASATWGRGRRGLVTAGGAVIIALTLWFLAWIVTIYWPQQPVDANALGAAHTTAVLTDAPDGAVAV